MINKVAASVADAIGPVPNGATVLVGGFGNAGIPDELVDGLIRLGATELTIVSNNAGSAGNGLARLLAARRVRKMVCSFPRQQDPSDIFTNLYKRGAVELELVAQGTLAERLRAAGAGVGAFFTPTAAGTDLAKGRETRHLNGRLHVLEYPIHGDLALVKAEAGDRWGNLTYRKTARNFGPVIAAAARRTVASVYELRPLGALDAEQIVTPGIHVHSIALIERTPAAVPTRSAERV